MKHYKFKTVACTAVFAAVFASCALAAGPYPPTDWPATINPAKKVHYFVPDTAAFSVPNANWNQSLNVLTGGDQPTENYTIGSPPAMFTGKKATGSYFNVADTAWEEWNSVDQIDILIQVYGDATVLNPSNQSQVRTWGFRTGTAPSSNPLIPANTISVANGYTTNANNNRWNWILFTIPNKIVQDGTGINHYVGSVPAGSTGNTAYGGVNGGTIRIGSAMSGIIIHAIAFGEAGAFGAVEDINQFEAPVVTQCDPVPETQLVGIDFNSGVSNYLKVMNDADQAVTFVNNAGPAGDQRKAVIPNGQYLNFGILSNYLGKPCNPNVTMKVGVEFYDDPAFAGQNVQFGPESYASDALGLNPATIYPASGLFTMQGTGRWFRKSWTISSVNLLGVNTAPLTGGPRFTCINAPVAVSRFYMAALRTSGPLAGQDPLADYPTDPLVCLGFYSDYVELDLANGTVNGLDVGNNGGDQTYVLELAGPANDRRQSIRGNGPEYYLNFAILTNAMGPTAQGNLHLAIVATYYDDPTLVGKAFRPQAWRYEAAGTIKEATWARNMVLQGTDKWRDAYWELGAIYLSGVNQGPQAAARFKMDDSIHISRLRYAVIRSCGPTAGKNLLDSRVPLAAAVGADSMMRLSWPIGAPQAQLQGVSAFSQTWTNVPGTPTVEGGGLSVLSVPISPDISSQFFRLMIIPQ